ncbi:MAG TPA: glycosyltransferase family 2 protein [Thermoplasmata archaeon]
MRGSLVVPTLNEAESIGHVLERFRVAAELGNQRSFASDPIQWEYLVVDGASTDGTARIAESFGARVIAEPRPGYGRAYRTGFEQAKGEVVATVDGDATYPVEEVPALVRRLFDRGLDFITCNRLAHLDPRSMTTEHRLGNWVLNSFVRVAFAHYLREAGGVTLQDSQSGMWVFRRAVLDRVRLTQDGMPFSEELKLEVILNGLKFEEVPIAYAERWGAPKLSSWRDGRRNMLFLFQKRLDVARNRRDFGSPVGRAPNGRPADR